MLHLPPHPHQAFSSGIGICFIELQGCSVRETKSRSFDLLTPHRCFRWGPDWQEAGLGERLGQAAQGGQRTEASSVGCQWVCSHRSPVNRVKVSGGSRLAQLWPVVAPAGMASGMGQVGGGLHAHRLAVHPSASQPSLGGLGRAGRPLCRKQ